MADHPETQFNFDIMSCFSGRFLPGTGPHALSGLNLGTVSTSSASDEFSYFTDQDPLATDGYTGAMSKSLNDAFKADTSGDIDRVLLDAKDEEPSLDPNAQKGLTHPNSTATYSIPV
jgi:hypothetical protein